MSPRRESLSTRKDASRSICSPPALIASLALLISMACAYAQEDFVPPSIPAVRTDTPPKLDGVLDDPCWQDAPVATDFTDTDAKRPAKQQTLVRVLYDGAYVYVAFECIEPEPEKIQAVERKHDRKLGTDDTVEVELDTFYDHRGRYVFTTNTLATRLDSREGLFGTNISWDCDWQAACTVGEDRWFAEMAIPIGELHYLSGDDVTWGVNFHRRENGELEYSTWSYYNEDTDSPRYFGTLVGLDLSQVKVKHQPDFEVYVSGTGDTKGNDHDASTGLDVSTRLSPQLISAFTINPDFGQVEADPDTIELRDTERFLEERRPFFKEGAELFDTPIDVYYSRRLADIDAGAKITGVGPRWNMGLLDVEGQIGRAGGHPDGNYFVGRLIRNIGEDNHIGAILVSSEREDGFNRIGGLDARVYLSDSISLYAQALGMDDEEEVVTVNDDGYETTETVKRDGYAMEATLEGGQRPIVWELALTDVSEDFRPDLGYVPRRDIRGGSATLDLGDYVAEGPLRWWNLGSTFTFYENHKGQTTLRDFKQKVNFEWRNEFEIVVNYINNYHAPYNNWEINTRLSYNLSNYWHSYRCTLAHGVFQEVPYDEYSVLQPFRLTERLTTELEANYRLEYADDGKHDVWLWRWITEYTFQWDARVKLTIEDSSEDRHNLTLLFTWYPREDWDVYVVLNDFRSADEEGQGVFAKLVRRF